MKKLYTLLAAICLHIAFVGTSLANEFIILNACEFSLQAIHLQKEGADTAYNVLESPLAAQEAIKVRMQEEEGSAWNVLAEDPAGSTVSFENIIFDDIKQIHIKGDGTIEIYR